MNWIFFPTLSRIGTKPAILSLVSQFAKTYRSKASDGQYPTVFSEHYNKESGSRLRGELLQKCEDVFENTTITAEETLNCVKVTRQQQTVV